MFLTSNWKFNLCIYHFFIPTFHWTGEFFSWLKLKVIYCLFFEWFFLRLKVNTLFIFFPKGGMSLECIIAFVLPSSVFLSFFMLVSFRLFFGLLPALFVGSYLPDSGIELRAPSSEGHQGLTIVPPQNSPFRHWFWFLWIFLLGCALVFLSIDV